MKKNAVPPPQSFMTPLQMTVRAKAIREELENRHKTGIAKMASADGTAVSTEDLQNELFSLIYRLSKVE